jgi:hypothetical protein
MCVNQCATLAGCGGAITDCVNSCTATPLLHQCFANARPTCGEVEFCALSSLCQPSGTQSCAATIHCYDACGTNRACICSCTQAASPSVGQLVLTRDACVLACGTANQACRAQHCSQLTTRCMSQ